MKKYMTLNSTVIGYKHIKKNIPCEDYSDSYSDDFCDIAIVADGHGDPACFRSKIGSKAVVCFTKVCFLEYINYLKNNISSFKKDMESPREQGRIVKNLTDTIIHKWYNFVFEDLNMHPITEAEYELAGTMAEKYKEGIKCEHIYGTTLIACLRFENYLFLIQQGDGRCILIDDEGNITQPIPWDDRCFENITTSMCDSDVATSIRYNIINLDEKPIIACLLGTDGVEDSYRNIEGTYCFYEQLCIDIKMSNFENLNDFINERLSVLSKEGSSDDISIAGIISLNINCNIIEQFKSNIVDYELSEKKSYLESKLASMERKYTILLSRYNNYKILLEDAKNKYEECKNMIIFLQDELENLKENTSDEKPLDNNILNKLKMFISDLIDLDDKSLDIQSQIEQKEKSLLLYFDEQRKLEKLINEYNKYIYDFNEYDKKYQDIKQQLKQLNGDSDE